MPAKNRVPAIVSGSLVPGIVIGLCSAALSGSGPCGPNISAPCTISSPGHYQLTANVTQKTFGADAIDITANDVVLDLNGHSVQGGPGDGNGIVSCASPASCATNVTIRNGHVKAAGSIGIDAGNTTHVEQVQAVSNGAEGIWPTDFNGNGFSILLQNVASRNGGDGIACGGDCLIMQNASGDNSADGITTVGGGIVLDNAASFNGVNGLNLGKNTGFGRNSMGSNGTCVKGGTSMTDNVCDGTAQ